MPKRTFQPKKRRRIRRLGFMSRMSSPGGRNILKRRRAKRRTKLTASDEIRSDKNKRIKRLK